MCWCGGVARSSSWSSVSSTGRRRRCWRRVSPTCSIGFAAFPILPEATAGDWGATLVLADEALYLAKTRRDAWVGVMRRLDDEPVTVGQDVRSLLRAGAFELVRSFDREGGGAP